MNSMQAAIIRKDIRGITANKRLFPVLIIVPLVLVILLPSMFILTFYFSPSEWSDFDMALAILARSFNEPSFERLMVTFIYNRLLPLFFMMIPVMSSSVMAAGSFVGEKEKKTLETLLYSPLTLKEVFTAKVAASFIMGMGVSLVSFAAMSVVISVETSLTFGFIQAPDVIWLVTLLFLSPIISLFAIMLIVQGSAKAKTMEESQQRSGVMILPIMLLMGGQLSGLYLVNAWMLMGVGAVLLVVMLFMLKRVKARFSYERLIG